MIPPSASPVSPEANSGEDRPGRAGSRVQWRRRAIRDDPFGSNQGRAAMTGPEAGDEDGLIRVARDFRAGRIDRRTLIGLVEDWAGRADADPNADAGETIALPGAVPRSGAEIE